MAPLRALGAALLALSSMVSQVNGLYFYIDGTTPKCFFEELAKDTMVVGALPSSTCSPVPLTLLLGSYKAEAFNTQSNAFYATPELAIAITVDEVFDNDHRVVSQTSTSSNTMSKFTFSAADSGLHRLCFTPSGPAAISVGGWFSGAGASAGGVKLTLDLAIGETSKIESRDKDRVESIVGKVRELNGRLQDIRREQVFQRVNTLLLVFGNEQIMLTMLRNGKPNFETKARRQTARSCGGR